MATIARGLLAFIVALAVTYVLATGVATQSVMASLQSMGVTVSFGDRVATTLADQVGMFGTHAPLLLVALAVGFGVAALICRWLPGWRAVGYPLAGFVAIVLMHNLMRMALEVTPVAAARSVSGLIMLGLAGALGGYVFYLVAPRGTPAQES